MKEIILCKNEKGEEICKQIVDLDNRTSILICKGDTSWNLTQYNKNGDKLYDANSKSPDITSYEYDENGNLVKEIDLLSGSYKINKYDENNNIIYSEKNGKCKKYEYDHKGRLVRIINENRIRHIEYDDDTNSVKEYNEYEDGHRNMFTTKRMDENGRIIFSSSSDSYSFEYEYDDKTNTVKKYSYKNKNGKEKEVTVSTYKYNDKGNLIYSEDSLGNKRFYETTYED